MSQHDVQQQIHDANEEVVKRLCEARPFLVDMVPAKDVVPKMNGMRVHHSGPPITTTRMCGAQKGAIVCAALTEGWAKTPQEAFRLLENGEISLGSNHEHQSVGPMAGIVSPNTWVFVVENRAHNNISYAPDQQARTIFGAYDEDDALAQRRLSRDVIGPTLRAALKRTGPIDLGPIMAQALHMGDELHNRVTAAGCLLFRALAPGLFDVGGAEAQRTLEYISNEGWFFLPIAMGAGKAMSDAAAGIEYSTIVTTMCRNGTDFGVRVSGLQDRWFIGPAQKVRGPYLPGYSDADAGLDLGDSAVVEVIGVGGGVMAAGAALLAIVGGTAADALGFLPRMRQICVGENRKFTVPIHDFAPAPTGIDIRRVVKTGILPIIDTAIAHREPGHHLLGAGMVEPPMECFTSALKAFAAHYLPNPNKAVN